MRRSTCRPHVPHISRRVSAQFPAPDGAVNFANEARSIMIKSRAAIAPIETMTPRPSRWRPLSAARALLAVLVLFCVAGPLHAAEEDEHVLMLYGLDPYLAPFLVMDKAVRESLASENGGRPYRREILGRRRQARSRWRPRRSGGIRALRVRAAAVGWRRSSRRARGHRACEARARSRADEALRAPWALPQSRGYRWGLAAAPSTRG
jgi:hypothetical protein